MDSPAYSVHSDFSDMDDDELDLYLANCVPLSNLPTPPPAKEYALPTASLPTPPADIELQRHTPELEIYAMHLAHLVPRNVCAQDPAVPAVREFLERAGLPVEVVAFAGCILDALSSSFAARWRDALMPMDETRLDFYLGPNTWTRPIIKPELIILSGLALAHDFLEDRYRSNSHWARIEGNGRFITREVEITKMCMLQDLDYGLFRITGEMVQRMMRDMHLLNTTTYFFPAVKDSRSSETEEQRPKLALSTGAPGAATWVHGVHTPEPSP